MRIRIENADHVFLDAPLSVIVGMASAFDVIFTKAHPTPPYTILIEPDFREGEHWPAGAGTFASETVLPDLEEAEAGEKTHAA